MPKRPSDMNHHAKHTVDLATGQARDEAPKGRQLSGIASAANLTPEQRRDRAKKAAAARWGNGAKRGDRGTGSPPRNPANASG